LATVEMTTLSVMARMAKTVPRTTPITMVTSVSHSVSERPERIRASNRYSPTTAHPKLGLAAIMFAQYSTKTIKRAAASRVFQAVAGT
jgi:hypothetical protein